MATGKKTFIFYADWVNMVRELPPNDAGELFQHLLAYVNDENPTTDNLMVKVVFAHFEPMLKADLKKWDKKIESYKAMGKASAAKRNLSQPTLTKVEPTSTVNDNVNVNVNVNDTVNDNKKKEITINKPVDPFLEEQFIEFWSNYPRKVGKPKAMVKFNKLSLTERETAIKGALLEKTLFDNNPQAEMQYIAHPTTWLNEKRFNDADHFQSKMDTKQLKSRQAEINRENMMIRIREREAKRLNNET